MTESALLDETIGANFGATVAAYPNREALVEFATGRRSRCGPRQMTDAEHGSLVARIAA